MSGHRNFKELVAKMSPERRARIMTAIFKCLSRETSILPQARSGRFAGECNGKLTSER